MKQIRVNRRNRAGFTLVEIMIVVAIIGLLAAIAIPNFIRSRRTAQSNACINNLRQIDSAKQQWALENGKVGSETPGSSELAVYINRDQVFPSCPLDAGTSNNAYAANINAVTNAPQCQHYLDDPVDHPANFQ